MKRAAIVNFTGFRNNWGCQTTSFELLKFAGEIMGSDAPVLFSIIPLMSHCAMDLEYHERLDEIYDAFTAVASGGAKAGESLAWLERICLRRFGRYAEDVRAADVVFYQAEGAMGLGSDFAHGPRLMLVPFVAKHAWGKTVIGLNQSFYAQDERVIRNAVETFGAMDFCAFREGASVALARQCGLKRAAYVPDLAFRTAASGGMAGPNLSGDPEYFAISGSALKDPERHQLILDLGSRIKCEFNLRPLIALSRDNKLKIKARLAWRPGSYAAIPGNFTYTNVAALLEKCAFLVGGRYHMAIMSAAVGTYPFLLSGNSFKNDGLSSLLGLDQPVRGFRQADDLLGDIARFQEDRQTKRQKLAESVAQIRTTIDRAGQHLQSVVNGKNPGPFDDGLPQFKVASVQDTLEKYRKFGSGKLKSGWRVKLAKCIPAPATASQILDPLIEAHSGDRDRVRHVLTHFSKQDPQLADYIKKASARLDGWEPGDGKQSG